MLSIVSTFSLQQILWNTVKNIWDHGHEIGEAVAFPPSFMDMTQQNMETIKDRLQISLLELSEFKRIN